jgi:hypothetical protein
MNVWFGTDWGAPVCQLTPQVPAPVGATCLWCEEPIATEDSGWGQCANGPWMHVECFGRQMFGSTGHQLRLCPCYGGTYEGEPESMSKRDAARAAWDLAFRNPPRDPRQ